MHNGIWPVINILALTTKENCKSYDYMCRNFFLAATVLKVLKSAHRSRRKNIAQICTQNYETLTIYYSQYTYIHTYI